MHVLLFIDSLAGGGAQRQLVHLAVGLAERGHRVEVTTYAPLEHHLPSLRAAGIGYRCVGKRYRFDLGPARDLRRILRVSRPDVAVAFLRTPVAYAELLRLTLPSVPLIVSERSGVSPRGLRPLDLLAGLGHALASHVTANSEDYLHRLTRALPFLRARSSVIRNGIDDRFFARGRRRLAHLLATDATPPDPPAEARPAASATLRLCVVAARVSPEKGALVTVDALAHLARRGVTAVRLDWIGPAAADDPRVVDVDRRLRELGLETRWRWRGAFDDVGRAFDEQDALLLPSLHEGTANALCEAMCAGLPVIATDIADNAVVLEGGRAGLLCRAGDAGSLADAIARFVDLAPPDRQMLALRAFRRAEALYSMAGFVDRWEALCRDVVHGSGRRAARARAGR